MIADNHIPARPGGHAEGEPRRRARRALSLGMSAMGLADHLRLVAGGLPGPL